MSMPKTMICLFSSLLVVVSSAASSRQLLSIEKHQVGQKISNGAHEGLKVRINYDGTIIATKEERGHTGTIRTYKLDAVANEWKQIGQALNSEGRLEDYFGMGLTLNPDGNRMAIGKPGYQRNIGSVTMYQYNETTDKWDTMGSPIIGTSPVRGGNPSLGLGTAVAMAENGNVVAMGDAFYDGNKGRVFVYRWNPATSNWTQVGQTLNSESYALYGMELSINEAGTKLVIGGRQGAYGCGVADVFDLVGNEWQRDVTLTGIKSGHICPVSRFGGDVGVAADGKTIVVGAYTDNVPGEGRGKDGEGYNEGSVYIYQANASSPTGWTRSFAIHGNHSNQLIGSSVAISDSGNIIAYGAPDHEDRDLYDKTGDRKDLLFSHGMLAIWRRNPNAVSNSDLWEEVLVVNTQEKDQKIGYSLAISGNGRRIVTGGPGHENFHDDTNNGYTLVLEIPAPTAVPTAAPTAQPTPVPTMTPKTLVKTSVTYATPLSTEEETVLVDTFCQVAADIIKKDVSVLQCTIVGTSGGSRRLLLANTKYELEAKITQYDEAEVNIADLVKVVEFTSELKTELAKKVQQEELDVVSDISSTGHDEKVSSARAGLSPVSAVSALLIGCVLARTLLD